MRSPAISLSSKMMMHSEATAFVDRGFSPVDACRLVGLPLIQFYSVGGSERIKFLPTPNEIETITARMRDGERVCTRRSQLRWLAETRKAEEGQAVDERYELAGRIADDACDVPEWLYSASGTSTGEINEA